jgi:hypothetical protein
MEPGGFSRLSDLRKLRKAGRNHGLCRQEAVLLKWTEGSGFGGDSGRKVIVAENQKFLTKR